MSDCRKMLVLPVSIGKVEFATSEWVTVAGVNLERSQIVGRQPERNELVIVLDVQDLVDALRDGDDELVEIHVNGTVTRKSAKAVWLRLDDERTVSLPTRYVEAEVTEYVREVRIPRWLAEDRGL